MFRNVAKGGHDGVGANGPVVVSIVSRLETIADAKKDTLRQRRIKNIYAEAKFRGIPLPALRALIAARRRLRLIREELQQLPPHRRAEVSALACAINDSSELFQFDPAQSTHIELLRAKP